MIKISLGTSLVLALGPGMTIYVVVVGDMEGMSM